MPAKRLRRFVSGTTFCIISDHKTVDGIGKVGGYNARVKRWLEVLSVLDWTTARAAPSEKIDLPSRLPDYATDHDRSWPSSLSPVDDGGIYFILARRVRTRSIPSADVGFGGVVPIQRSRV